MGCAILCSNILIIYFEHQYLPPLLNTTLLLYHPHWSARGSKDKIYLQFEIIIIQGFPSYYTVPESTKFIFNVELTDTKDWLFLLLISFFYNQIGSILSSSISTHTLWSCTYLVNWQSLTSLHTHPVKCIIYPYSSSLRSKDTLRNFLSKLFTVI